MGKSIPDWPLDPAYESGIHEKLLSGDPVAPSELIERCLRPLKQYLRRHFPRLQDPHLYDIAVHEALIDYVKEPEKYDPGRSSLSSYLQMAARRDLLNAWHREQRPQDEKRREHVENLDSVRNGSSRGSLRNDTEEDRIITALYAEELRGEALDLFDDEKDRLFLCAWLDEGERDPKFAAKILNVDDLPEQEQAHEIKKARDRIMAKLRRHFVENTKIGKAAD